jgi:hypothetical protein
MNSRHELQKEGASRPNNWRTLRSAKRSLLDKATVVPGPLAESKYQESGEN